MTTAEILSQIYQLPVDQQQDLKKIFLEDSESNDGIRPQMKQNEFDQVLFDSGFLVKLPVETEEDNDFSPVEFTGKPVSETIIEERR